MSKHHRNHEFDGFGDFDDEPRRGRAKAPRGGRRKAKVRICRAAKSKFRYPDEEAAKDALFNPRQIKKANPDAYVPIRYYACHACQGYHLTSQEERSAVAHEESAHGAQGDGWPAADRVSALRQRASDRPGSRPHMRMRANGKNSGSSSPNSPMSLSEYLSRKPA